MEVHLRSSRGRSRTRQKHFASKRSTGARHEDEQISWIADDICTRCGAAAPHGKLYCSIKCRNADIASESSIKKVEEDDTVLHDSLNQLRYPMTLSPHLTPFSLKPTTSLRKSSAPKHGRNGTSTCSLACDGDSQGVCRAHARKASQSTDSDVSDLIDTDLTTPSPWRIGIDAPDDSDGISDLDDAELRLPPSVLGSEPASMPVTSGAIPLSIQSGTRTPRPHKSCTSPALLPQLTAPSQHVQSPILFHRMPSSTNLPSSMGFISKIYPSHSLRHSHIGNFESNSSGQCTPQFRRSPPRRVSPEREQGDVFHPNTLSKASTIQPTYPQEASIIKSSPETVYPTSQGTVLNSRDINSASQHCAGRTSPGVDAMHKDDNEEPQRGRSRTRHGHSCCTGRRRSLWATCHACSLPTTSLPSHQVLGNALLCPSLSSHNEENTKSPVF